MNGAHCMVESSDPHHTRHTFDLQRLASAEVARVNAHGVVELTRCCTLPLRLIHPYNPLLRFRLRTIPF